MDVTIVVFCIVIVIVTEASRSTLMVEAAFGGLVVTVVDFGLVLVVVQPGSPSVVGVHGCTVVAKKNRLAFRISATTRPVQDGFGTVTDEDEGLAGSVELLQTCIANVTLRKKKRRKSESISDEASKTYSHIERLYERSTG